MPQTLEEKAAYMRDWRKKKGPEYVAAQNKRMRKYGKARRAEMRSWLKELKETTGCLCGQKDGRCLTFHHKRGTQKEFTISRGVERSLSREELLKEIEKCEILCANCHAIEHYEEGSRGYHE